MVVFAGTEVEASRARGLLLLVDIVDTLLCRECFDRYERVEQYLDGDDDAAEEGDIPDDGHWRRMRMNDYRV